jgi:PAS domain S-box-containing protein
LIDPEFQTLLIHAIFDNSPNGILVVNDKNIIVSHNRQFIDIWGIDKALLQGTKSGTAIGMNHEITLKSVLPRMKNPQEILTSVQELLANPHVSNHCEIEMLDGRAVEWITTGLYGNDDKYYGRAWFFRDITEQKNTESALKALSYEDALTRLPNRRYFFDQAAKEVALSLRYANPLSIGILDIDYFKKFNDHHGHWVGDEVLKAVSRAIQSRLR